MFKKFRKMTTLALVLALILAMSATDFAADSFDEIWYAEDYTNIVDASARIESDRTYGEINSSSNAGEVYLEYYYYYLDGGVQTLSGIWNASDIDHVYACSANVGTNNMKRAYYTFFAYVPTDVGDSYYNPDPVELYYSTNIK